MSSCNQHSDVISWSLNTQNALAAGVCPRPRLQSSPDTLADFSKGEGKEKSEKGMKDREEESEMGRPTTFGNT